MQVTQLQRLSAKAHRLVLGTDQHEITRELHEMAIITIRGELDELMDQLPEHMKANCKFIKPVLGFHSDLQRSPFKPLL